MGLIIDANKAADYLNRPNAPDHKPIYLDSATLAEQFAVRCYVTGDCSENKTDAGRFSRPVVLERLGEPQHSLLSQHRLPKALQAALPKNMGFSLIKGNSPPAASIMLHGVGMR